MTAATYIVGDSLTVLRTLPDASVDLVMSSPPFLALRSYLPADHPDKAKEIGSEATPGEFLDVLLDIVVECRRVLAPHGSLVFELGDTYSGSGGAGGDYNEGGLRDGQATFDGSSARARRDGGRYAGGYSGGAKGFDVEASNGAFDVRPSNGGPGWPLAKSLTLIPQSFAWALAYGRNPFTGREIEPWRIRNMVAWCRPNPPVGALGDKFRPATSYLTVACVSGKRYFDLDAVRTEHKSDPRNYSGNGYTKGAPEGVPGNEAMPGNPAGAPPLDFWVIPTQPYKGSHYATMPKALVVPVVKSMAPAKVCRTCGEPQRRLTKSTRTLNGEDATGLPQVGMSGGDPRTQGRYETVGGATFGTIVETIGWSDCGHNDWRHGVVFDPFAGSGTTLEVATGHGRDAIGIDLDSRNAALALERVGPLLVIVEYHQEDVA